MTPGHLELESIALLVGLLLSLTLNVMHWWGTRMQRRADESEDDRWAETRQKLAEINGLSVWRQTSERERLNLWTLIRENHDKHKVEEQRIRDEMLKMNEVVEKRLHEEVRAVELRGQQALLQSDNSCDRRLLRLEERRDHRVN